MIDVEKEEDLHSIAAHENSHHGERSHKERKSGGGERSVHKAITSIGFILLDSFCSAQCEDMPLK